MGAVDGARVPVLVIVCRVAQGILALGDDPSSGYLVWHLIIPASIAPWLAVIFGHVALIQIESKGERGTGQAVAGLVLGYMSMALMLMFVVGLIVFAGVVVHSIDQST